MKAKLIQLGLKALKNEKLRRTLIIAVLVFLFFASTGPIVIGATALSTLANAIKLICSGSGITAESMNEDDWLKAFDEGFSFKENEEVALKIRQEDFRYLLQRVHDYNNADKVSREITIQGRKDYLVRVSHTSYDEEGNSYTTYSYEPRVAYPEKKVTVSNKIFEGLDHLDYRLLYYGCIAATAERKSSDAVLSGITPLDKDLKPIGSWDPPENDSARYMISREDVDRVFTYLTISYNYYFDVLRDDRDYYSFDECMSLPHEYESHGNPNTTSGQTQYYHPRSFLTNGYGKFSHIEKTLNSSGDALIATKAVFDYNNLSSALISIYPHFTWEETTTIMDLLPGGKALMQKYKEWGDIGYVFAKTSGYKIEINPSWATYSVGTVSGILDLNGKSLSSEQLATLSTLWNFLISNMGFSNAAAAGICGNAYQENGFRYTIASSGPIGLFQWAGTRKTRLLAKKNPESLETQLSFFKEEWNSSYAGSANAYSQRYFGNLFSNETNPQSGGESFCVTFEGCIYNPAAGYGKSSDPTLSTMASNGKRYQELALRMSFAQSIYDFMCNGGVTYSGEVYSGTDLPYYAQGDPQWGSCSLGIGNIASRGCSLACAAMAASYCLRRTVTPKDIASIPEVYSWTSTHTSMNQEPSQMALRKLGVSFIRVGNSKEKMTAALLKHHPVIISVKSGSYNFTSGTHYIVLRYMDSKGGVYLHDPNGSHSSYSTRAYNLDIILSQLNNVSGCIECIPKN